MLLLFGLYQVVAVQPAAADRHRVVPRSAAEVKLSYAPLVKRVAPAVVNIYAQRVVRTGGQRLFDDPFFRRFFGDDFLRIPEREQVQKSLGSGVVIRPEGIVVTNNHVIEGATEITIVLNDRREFDAEILLADAKSDLAVLKVATGGLKMEHLTLADSDDLEVGDVVLAIGNPFGVGQTVTQGIVSALARTNVSSSGLQAFIQTDAAINPGNSGGALVALDGDLVGVNTAIFSRSGGSHGIGFAIPSNLVAAVVRGALTGGRIVRPWFGASGQPVDRDVAASLGLDRPGGVLINGLHPKGPAAKAGLRVGDVLVAVNGHPVVDFEGLNFRIATLEPGKAASIAVLRRGRSIELDLALEPPPEDPPRDMTLLKGRHPVSGAEVGNLSPALAEELGMEMMAEGVVVVRVRRGSPAHRSRLRPNDVLVALNDKEIKSVAALKRMLRGNRAEWHFVLRRGQKLLNLVVRS